LKKQIEATFRAASNSRTATIRRWKPTKQQQHTDLPRDFEYEL